MKGNPKWDLGQIVKFTVDNSGEIYEGIIRVVDAYGTFEDPSDVSYDIMTPDCFYKHVREDFVIG